MQIVDRCQRRFRLEHQNVWMRPLFWPHRQQSWQSLVQRINTRWIVAYHDNVVLPSIKDRSTPSFYQGRESRGVLINGCFCCACTYVWSSGHIALHRPDKPKFWVARNNISDVNVGEWRFIQRISAIHYWLRVGFRQWKPPLNLLPRMVLASVCADLCSTYVRIRKQDAVDSHFWPCWCRYTPPYIAVGDSATCGFLVTSYNVTTSGDGTSALSPSNDCRIWCSCEANDGDSISRMRQFLLSGRIIILPYVCFIVSAKTKQNRISSSSDAVPAARWPRTRQILVNRHFIWTVILGCGSSSQQKYDPLRTMMSLHSSVIHSTHMPLIPFSISGKTS